MLGIEKKKALVFIVFIGILFISGCVEGQNTDWNDVAIGEAGSEEIISETSGMVQKDNVTISNSDSWGLNDIKEIFELWGWYPSTDPANIEEISKETGKTISDIEDQEEKLKGILLSIPEIQEDNTEVLFLTDIAKQQFVSIEWGKYTFDECEILVIAGNANGFWGRVYLRNSNEVWKSSKPAIFLSFYYAFESQQPEILEMIETTSGIVDYKVGFEYGDDETTLQLHEIKGLRLLDTALELNQVEEFTPIAGLEGIELEQYTEKIFLDLYRCPNNLYKYRNVFTEDTISLLETVEYYYDKPDEIYDFAETRFYTETTGTVSLGSQFQTFFWETIMIEIDFDFEYEKMTGMLAVYDGEMRIVEKN